MLNTPTLSASDTRGSDATGAAFSDDELIAVVGIGCRFPRSISDHRSYWDLLMSGASAISEAPADRFAIESFYDPNPDALGRSNTKWGGFLEDVRSFDAGFFDISPREAQSMDPQQRVLLEVVQEALDDACLTRREVEQVRTGVFIGISVSDYGVLQRYQHTKSDVYAGTGSALSIAANRISHRFNLGGPSNIVDTACSSSLVALDQAVVNLREGRCEVALAGGVNVLADPGAFVAFSKAGMLSPTGTISTFDSRANGYVRGEGAGIVVLKRLSDAIAAHDRIYARIRATCVNQDGRTSTLTAPNGAAQKEMLRELCRRAKVSPVDVDYVEAHGTGTPVGDPIEADAIGSVFGQARDEAPVLVGSVKPNIGHLESAAGISGFIKAVLIAHHGAVPPNANFAKPNPLIPFDALNIEVPRAMTPVAPQGRAPLVVVNSFGFGGTNASALVEGHHPAIFARGKAASAATSRAIAIPLSGATEASLRGGASRLAESLESGAFGDHSLADIAASIGAYRSAAQRRAVVVAETAAEAVERLRTIATNGVPPPVRGQLPFHVGGTAQGGRRIVFTFAGQGGQWWAMARRLMVEDAAFRTVFNDFDAIFSGLSGWSIKTELLKDEGASRVNESRVAQPGIFGVQIGLAASWAARGVHPDMVVGHSFGEVAAAHTSGALDLEAATRLISTRAGVNARIEDPGTMMAVGMSPEAFTAFAGPDSGIEIAAFNGPTMITVSGPIPAIEAVRQAIAADMPDTLARRLATDTAWHSRQLDPTETWFRESLGSVAHTSPSIPFASTVTGKFETVLDLDYWWRNLRQPVNYQRAIELTLETGADCFLELSPHRVLSGLTAGVAANSGKRVVIANSLIREQDDFHALAVATGELFCAGVALDWPAVTAGTPFKGDLPAYSWDRQPFWQESEEAHALLFGAKGHPLLGTRARAPGFTWTKEFNLTSDRYLAGHAIDGDTIFPAAGYIEIMLAAGRDALGEGVIELIDVEFLAALFIRNDDNIILATSYDPRSGLIEIFSRVRDESPNWTARARGHMRLTDAAVPTGPMIEIVDRHIDHAEFYHQTELHGLQYAQSFQSVANVEAGGAMALAHVAAPAGTIANAERFLAHPGLLDSAFQTVVVMGLAAGDDDNFPLYLPVGVRRLRLVGRLPERFTALAELSPGATPQTLSADYFMRDDSGATLLEVDGLILKQTSSRRADEDEETHARHFVETFVETELPAPAADVLAASAWLVVAGDEAAAAPLIATLETFGATAATLPLEKLLDFDNPDAVGAAEYWDRSGAARSGVLFAAPTLAEGPAPDATGEAVAAHVERLSSALIGLGRYLNRVKDASAVVPEVVVMTRGARQVAQDGAMSLAGLASSAMVGLTRTVANECPANRFVAIDWDGGIDGAKLAAIIADSRGESEWIVREAGVLVPRLRTQSPAELPPQRIAIDAARDAANFELTMKAPGSIGGLVLRQNEMPVPAAGEVLLRTLGVGLNFRDVMAATGLLPAEAEPDPAWLNLGLEYSARVVSVGQGVTGLKPGDRVMAMGRHCLQAFQTVDARALIALPDNLGDDEAATIPSAFATAHYALQHVGRLRRGERILIHLGTGGVGLAAIQIARNVGAEIFATAGSEEKRDYLRRLGIPHVMHSRSLTFFDEVMEATSGEGVDIVLNALPTAYIEKGVQLLKPFGRFLEIGKRDVYADTPIGMHGLRRNISFSVIDLAAMGKDRPDLLRLVFEEVAAAIAAGELKPLPLIRFPVDKSVDAFRLMSQAKHIGKVVIGFGDGPVEVAAMTGRGFAARADGNYLITGGSRGFGLTIAEWLSRSGAGEITLASRSGKVDDGLEPLLDAMRARGTHVTSRALDVADSAAVDALVAELAAGERRLSGIIHGAAYIKDAFIGQLDRKTIADVIGPKVGGGWNLHRALDRAGVVVDLFVSFSSLAQVIGSIGQANYVAANAFLDGLAFYRRGEGKAALTIDWGALGGSGFVARNEAMSRYLDSLGMEPIADSEALAGLDQTLESDVASVAFARVDWLKVGRAMGAKGVTPRLSLVMSGRREGTNQIQVDLAAATQAEWPGIVETFLVTQVATVLGIDSAEVSLDNALAELGFDSLSSIELKNRLEGQLGLSVSVGTFLQAKTLGDLVGLVIELLVQKARATAARADGDADAATGGQLAAGRDDGFAPAIRQRRSLLLATGPMASPEGRAALENAAALSLADDAGLGEISAAWTALCQRHPLLAMRHDATGLILGDTPSLSVTDDLSDALAEPLDLAFGELVRAEVAEPAGGAPVLGLRLHASVADRRGLHLALAEWAALARGETLPDAPGAADVFAALRPAGPDDERHNADRAYWHALLVPWPPAIAVPGRRLALAPVGLGLNAGRAGELHIDLAAAPAGVETEPWLLGAFSLALLKHFHAPAVLVERHAPGPLAGSVGPWTIATPTILRSGAAGLEAAMRRIGRQLGDAGGRCRFDLATAEAVFADEMRRAGAVPGQFAFTLEAAPLDRRPTPVVPDAVAHDLHLRATPTADGFSVSLSFDAAALDEASVRALLAGFVSIATGSADLHSVPRAVRSASAPADTAAPVPLVPLAQPRARNGSNGGSSHGLAAPAASHGGRGAALYPVLASTRNLMSVLHRPETTRTFAANWNVNQALLMRPGIDVHRMSAALASLVARHDTLRLRYRVTGDQMLALVDERYQGQLEVHELGDVARDELMEAIDQVADRPFDIERGPLFELHVFKCGAIGDAVLVHLCEFIADGWSIALIIDELVRHYLGIGAPEGDGTRYSELLKATALPSDPSERAALDAYWQGVLDRPVPQPTFGRIAKHHPAATPGMQAPYQRRSIQINATGAEHMRARGTALGVNENALFAAAIIGAAANEANTESVYFGAVHTMRNAPVLRDKIALIADILPVRADVAEAGNFEGLARQLHTRFTHNSEHARPGLSFDPPALTADGRPSAQSAWTEWAYGRLLPEHMTASSMAAPLIGSTRGTILKVLSAEIEALPMRPYGFTRGDFALRPLTNENGIEVSFFHDLLSLTPKEAEQLMLHALDDMGLSRSHFGEELVSEIMGDPLDIARLRQGLAPEPYRFGRGNG